MVAERGVESAQRPTEDDAQRFRGVGRYEDSSRRGHSRRVRGCPPALRDTVIEKLVFRLWLLDARRKLRHLRPHLGVDQSILDIGCGVGSVTTLLRAEGYTVTPLDVRAQSLTAAVAPVIFDGRHVPFDAGHFDLALLLTVLHHAEDPEALLLEAARVARRIVVIEDTYDNRVQRALTLATDSVVNLEFRGHPHNNRSDREWRATFDRLELRVLHATTWPIAALFQQSFFLLEPARS